MAVCYNKLPRNVFLSKLLNQWGWPVGCGMDCLPTIKTKRDYNGLLQEKQSVVFHPITFQGLEVYCVRSQTSRD